MSKKFSRRVFITGTSAAFAGTLTGVVRARPKRVSANDKLNIAAIGAGGKGKSDIYACRSENVIALCDIDERQARESLANFPDAKFYMDFREMLDKHPEIDACTVSTPDHTHAVAAAAAMKLGKHVYVQKPLTHDIYEARMLRKIANDMGVATQMGNQGHSDEGVRQMCEMIWGGAIGDVTEVHIWTNRPIWAQGLTAPEGEDSVPEWVDWDLWLGTAEYRPYVRFHPETRKPCYHPWHWRGWWDFGTGALGDMACHIMDPANWALKLDNPTSIEPLILENKTEDQAPVRSKTKYEFGARGDMPPVKVYWYEGGLLPDRPADIPADQELGDGDNGSLFIGTEGYATCGEYGGKPRLLPASRMADYTMPDPSIPRVPGNSPYADWIRACKGGPAACSNFDYSGPFTEIVLLGALAQRAGTKIEWDAGNMQVTNEEAKFAQKWVKRDYREPWTL